MLPQPYARGLRLHERGAGDAEVAASAGIEPASVRSFLELAEAKLQRILAERELRPELASTTEER